jgi:Outer membrane protein beta-barrel domain
MKKLWLVFIASALAFGVFAQDTTKVAKPVAPPVKAKGPSEAVLAHRRKLDKEFAKYSRDHLTLDLNGTNWIYNKNAPGFGGSATTTPLQTKWFSRGIGVYFNWDFRIKGSRVSFAPGIGYSCSNIYSRSKMIQDSAGPIHFEPLPTYVGDTSTKINKLTLQYFNIPLELRIRSDIDKFGNCWKVAIGFKLGVLVDSHTKTKMDQSGVEQVFVVRRFHDFSQWDAGPTIRVGYSFFNITATYGIVNIFKPGLQPPGSNGAHAFSLGISFTAL